MARQEKVQGESPGGCPVCGEDVPPGALACPQCGADHNSGWREGAGNYDGVDLPDEFNYEEFTRSEFGSSPKPAEISAIWWITAIVLVLLTLLYFCGVR